MINVAPQAKQLVQRVFDADQNHIFKYWDELPSASRNALMDQIRQIDFDLLQKLQAYGSHHADSDSSQKMEPADYIGIPRTDEEKERAESAKQIGEQVIGEGRIGAFVVAGGQGTRLGFDGPKGMFPIGSVTNKTLFQLHAEKILAANRKYNVNIPWYIMTSETNDEATQQYFQQNNYLGLDEKDVFFFKQRMVPALDENGKLVLDRKDHLFMSPNGHGGSLLALMESGAVSDMEKRGITQLSYFQVDNVLIKIIDPVFIGYHVQAQAEMSSKMAMKTGPDEKVGVFGRIDGVLKVIEYSDMEQSDMTATNPDGSLKYGAGSIAIHLIDIDFVKQEVADGFRLPYHRAHKKIPILNADGKTITPDAPNGYKFETFVFDALSDTTSSIIMEVIRKDEFSPVKNLTGVDSAESAKRDLSNYSIRQLIKHGVFTTEDVKGLVEVSELADLNAIDESDQVFAEFEKTRSLYIGP